MKRAGQYRAIYKKNKTVLNIKIKRGCQHPSHKFEILWQVAQNSISLQLSCFVAQYGVVFCENIF